MFSLWHHRFKTRGDAATLLRQMGKSEDPAERERLQQRLGRPTHIRPKGDLAWVHIGGICTMAAVALLVARLRDDHGPLAILLTSEQPVAPGAIPGAIVQLPPIDSDDTARGFLDHWHPDICLWIGAHWAPVLLAETARRSIPALCVDMQLEPTKQRMTPKALAHGPFAAFAHILTGSARDAQRLITAGAAPGQVETCGWLEASSGALPANDAEWGDMRQAFDARPIWLAADIPQEECAAVIEAHRLASRLSHRLILILAPHDPALGPVWRDKLESDGWQTALRSAEETPVENTQIYLADTHGELGLWYRLAPVTYMGQTLSGTGPGRSPMEPTALGSVVVHGPHTHGHDDAYSRLRRAGALSSVDSGATLGRMIEHLQAADKAAALANAGWEVMTTGAEATDRALSLLHDLLNQGHA
ncbi:3-deoxy-D-manno-octulosonic acid transferase [Oceaniglobus ichthyenteri]|uniref:3-deoxy-D-manno-octulosonic acid transferase n=1 Tax=Oceaniglobus ichthyenteri TaxID=2136177 RepID=UPI000D36D7C3|nr:glycosyltransferase N-terminal domain-containing protein [Oceaniglobus ichthyenteri]